MASYCLVNLVCRDYQLCFTLVFWRFVFCLSFCYLKLWSNHVAISNTEFCVMVWVKIAFGNMLDLVKLSFTSEYLSAHLMIFEGV